MARIGGLVAKIVMTLACVVAASLGATSAKSEDEWTATVAAKKSRPVNPYKAYLSNLKPMRFVIVRSAEASCGDDCPQWIAAEGDIVQGTAEEFKKLLRSLGKQRLPLLIHSGGGSVDDAIAMGKLIRARKLDVAVARTEFAACDKSGKTCKGGKPINGIRGVPVSHAAYCASSCAFVLASGVNRYVGPGAIVGVHRIKSFRTTVKLQRTFSVRKFVDSSGKIRTEKKLVKERRVGGVTRETTTTDRSYDPIEKHFAAMGISADLMQPLRQTPHEQMYWIPDSELVRTRLATSDINAVQTVALPQVEIPVAGKKSLAKARTELAKTGRLAARLTMKARTESGAVIAVDVGMAYLREEGVFLVSLQPAEGAAAGPIGLRGTIVLPNIVTAIATKAKDEADPERLQTRIAAAEFCRIVDSGHIVIKFAELAQSAPSRGNVVDVRGAQGAAELFNLACADTVSH